MKTAKVLIFATLLVFTSVSISNAGGFGTQKKNKIVNLTIVQALVVPGLPAAMLQQLDEEMVSGCDCSSFTVDVTLGNVIYRITGTKQEWVMFFNWGEILLQENSYINFSNN